MPAVRGTLHCVFALSAGDRQDIPNQRASLVPARRFVGTSLRCHAKVTFRQFFFLPLLRTMTERHKGKRRERGSHAGCAWGHMRTVRYSARSSVWGEPRRSVSCAEGFQGFRLAPDWSHSQADRERGAGGGTRDNWASQFHVLNFHHRVSVSQWTGCTRPCVKGSTVCHSTSGTKHPSWAKEKTQTRTPGGRVSGWSLCRRRPLLGAAKALGRPKVASLGSWRRI